MKRAALLIGVSKVNGLPTLKAVHKGVERMQDWALTQGMCPKHVLVLSDKKKGDEEDDKSVSADDCETAVAKLLKLDKFDQLIVYFAGHGVNVRYQEYWLLTRGIESANQSVNVAGSIERARLSNVGHVIFISDACRSAPQSIRESGVEGTVIFPNPTTVASIGSPTYVDVFFATRLGEPSLEIKDSTTAAGEFKAVYTESLHEALTGHHGQILETDEALQAKPRPSLLSLARHSESTLLLDQTITFSYIAAMQICLPSR